MNSNLLKLPLIIALVPTITIGGGLVEGNVASFNYEKGEGSQSYKLVKIDTTMYQLTELNEINSKCSTISRQRTDSQYALLDSMTNLDYNDMIIMQECNQEIPDEILNLACPYIENSSATMHYLYKDGDITFTVKDIGNKELIDGVIKSNGSMEINLPECKVY